jgi:hypothetical protein
MMWHCGTHELGRKIGKLPEVFYPGVDVVSRIWIIMMAPLQKEENAMSPKC